MITFIQGQNGGGNRLQIDIDDLYKYGVNLMNFQQVISMAYPQRENHSSEKRVWIMYKNKPICELGLDEIEAAINYNKNILDEWQIDTIFQLNTFIADYKQEIKKLISF